MTAVLLIALALCAASTLVGQALWTLAGTRTWSWLAPGTGFATLLALEVGAVRLPGHGTTALIALGLASLGSLVVLRRAGFEARVLVEGLPTALLAIGAAALPFLANARFGTLGVAFNGDLAAHLVYADALRVGMEPVEVAYYRDGYPIGSHALAAALASLGTDVERTFTALLLAVPGLTALTALTALREVALPWRVVAAVFTGLPYLGAAYLVQASFKEPIQAMLVLCLALALRELPAGVGRTRAAAVLGLLMAGGIANYSLAGLVWPVAVAVCIGVAHAGLRRRIPSPRRLLVANRAAIAVFAGTLLVAVAPQLYELQNFFEEIGSVTAGDSTGGNIPERIPGYEALGVWFNSDFRFQPNPPFYSGFFAAVAVAAALYGAVWWIRRRDLAIPAAIVGCGAVYLQARYAATPYYSAKALVILAPLIMLMTTRALVSDVPRWRSLRELRRLAPARLATVALALAYLGAAAWSSGLVLRGAHVSPEEHRDELGSLRPMLKGQPTVFLGLDDFVYWRLRGSRLVAPITYFGTPHLPFSARRGKVPQPGWPMDFDSIDPHTADRFRYLVAPRTGYASEPPLNWRRVRSTRSYEVWERRGATAPRSTLREVGKPGAILRCGDWRGRILSLTPGVARVGPIPVVGAPKAWVQALGVPPILDEGGFFPLPPATTASQTLNLPPGEWDISLQYLSHTPLEVRAAGLRTEMPPIVASGGPYWSVGRVRSDGGSTVVQVTPAEPPRLSTPRLASVGTVAATRVDVRRQTVPLRRACGRYVDWYTTGMAREGSPRPTRAS